jgi:hypothetical protein
MPFTLAHPAAILPFYRARQHKLRLAALAIGAMAPDLQFLLGLSPNGWFSHTLPGLFLICLPASWILLRLFDRWGRRGIARFLPSEWTLPAPPPSTFWWVSFSILIGASTHVVWDAFTHESEWGFQVLTGLKGSFVPSWRPGMPGFKLLQDGSTVVGLTCLAWAGAAWARRQPAAVWGPPIRRASLLLVVLALVGFAAGLQKTHGRFFGGHEREVLSFGGIAVTLVFGLAVLLLGVKGERRPVDRGGP